MKSARFYLTILTTAGILNADEARQLTSLGNKSSTIVFQRLAREYRIKEILIRNTTASEMLEFIRLTAERPGSKLREINQSVRLDGSDPVLALVSWKQCSYEQALEMICGAAGLFWWIEDRCIAIGPKSVYEKRKVKIAKERKLDSSLR